VKPVPTPIKGHVFLIEDDESVRESIASMLHFLNYRVHEYASAESFLMDELLAGPGVIVCDMRMSGMSGVQLQELLIIKQVTLPIIFISGESTQQQIIKSFKQGAFDFLLKPFDREDLLSAVVKGIMQDEQRMILLQSFSIFEASLSKLSPRERSVYELLTGGANNSEITQTLGISLPTAKQYKSEVMRKLGLKSLSELLSFHREMKSKTALQKSNS